MSYPGVSVNVTNGNLLSQIAVLDSVPALVATVNNADLIGETIEVYSLADAENKGFKKNDEPFMHGLLEEYYNELGGSQRLFVFGTAASMTMEDALKPATINGVNKMLIAGGGEINLIAIARNPEQGYDAGTAFLDADVEKAVIASKSLCEAMQRANTPVRVFIEGRVANAADQGNVYNPSEGTNGFAAVVLGGTKEDGSAAVSVALARACKYGSHVKLGNGQNGALSVQQIYIGNGKMEDRTDMETLHDKGFMTFMHRPGAAGYYFGKDNMCSTDDFHILVHGRVIDKAQRIAAKAYLPFVETDIRIEKDGTVNASDAAYIEGVLNSSIKRSMNGQISNVNVSIPLTQDIINTSSLSVDVKIQPLGYLTWIVVTIGLAATISTNS